MLNLKEEKSQLTLSLCENIRVSLLFMVRLLEMIVRKSEGIEDKIRTKR